MVQADYGLVLALFIILLVFVVGVTIRKYWWG